MVFACLGLAVCMFLAGIEGNSRNAGSNPKNAGSAIKSTRISPLRIGPFGNRILLERGRNK